MHKVIIVENNKVKSRVSSICEYAQKYGRCFIVYVIIDKKKI